MMGIHERLTLQVSTGQKKTPKEESKLKTAATPATPATPDSQKKRPAGSETVGKSEGES